MNRIFIFISATFFISFSSYAQDNSSIKNKVKGTGQTESVNCIFGDCSNGYGVYVYDDGDRYEGYFENGIRHGMGNYFYSSGSIYSGMWKNGDKHLFGMYAWADGDFYIGLWKDDERMRHGIYAWDDGNYEARTSAVTYSESGCVYGDCDNGFGVYIWSDGDIHSGHWKNGKQHGPAAKFWADGDFFYGVYKDGQRLSRGIYVYGDATIDMRNDRVSFENTGCLSGECYDGFGLYSFTDGDIHDGFWRDDLKHGLGMMFWESGDFFIGMYEKGTRLQRGIYAWPSGSNEVRTEYHFFRSE